METKILLQDKSVMPVIEKKYLDWIESEIKIEILYYFDSVFGFAPSYDDLYINSFEFKADVNASKTIKDRDIIEDIKEVCFEVRRTEKSEIGGNFYVSKGYKLDIENDHIYRWRYNKNATCEEELFFYELLV